MREDSSGIPPINVGAARAVLECLDPDGRFGNDRLVCLGIRA